MRRISLSACSDSSRSTGRRTWRPSDRISGITRLHSRPGATPFGLEVRYSEDLDAALERLRGLGVSAGRGSAEDCALRKVKDMIWLNDFSGNRVELWCGR
jgi:hypothetical protein